ncbi:hypothetical protein Leryth_013358, partial [Lithospermum erythrorhizon]
SIKLESLIKSQQCSASRSCTLHFAAAYLFLQLPGNNRHVDFGGLKTNGKSIAVHTLIFFTVYAILIMAVHIHIYTG